MATCCRSRTLAAAAALVLALAFALPLCADAALLEFVEAQREGMNGVTGLAGVLSVIVSADGNQVYAAGGDDNAVDVFQRDPATGALTLAQVVQDGADGVDGLAYASSLALSPDGAHLYVTGSRDGALAVFTRDATTGTLTFLEAQKNGVAGVEGLGFARGVAVSADGSHVYVVGQGDNALVVFRRNALTGWLTFVEVQRQGVNGVDGLAGPLAVAVSPDGGNVYVAAGDESAVTVFKRDATTGRLQIAAMERDGAVDLGLGGIHSVTVSSDGAFVYAAGQTDDAVATFKRNTRTGALSFVGVVSEGIDGADGLYGALWVAVSPDGAHAYVASTHDNAVVALDRDKTTGTLTYVENHHGGPDCTCLAFARGVAVSPDSKNVYVAGASSNALNVFRVTE